jgi:hypothetical protein
MSYGRGGTTEVYLIYRTKEMIVGSERMESREFYILSSRVDSFDA